MSALSMRSLRGAAKVKLRSTRALQAKYARRPAYKTRVQDPRSRRFRPPQQLPATTARGVSGLSLSDSNLNLTRCCGHAGMLERTTLDDHVSCSLRSELIWVALTGVIIFILVKQLCRVMRAFVERQL